MPLFHGSRASGKLATLLALLLFTTPGTAVQIGDMAPAFQLSLLDGEQLNLQDYRGRKSVYLVFWNTWCAYCVERAQRYQRLHESLGDRLEVIAINTTWSDSPEQIAQFQQRFALDYPILVDEGSATTRRYAVTAVPTEFIIDVNGVIRHRDHVPEFLAAHIPDWYASYRPGSATAQAAQMCTP